MPIPLLALTRNHPTYHPCRSAHHLPELRATVCFRCAEQAARSLVVWLVCFISANAVQKHWGAMQRDTLQRDALQRDSRPAGGHAHVPSIPTPKTLPGGGGGAETGELLEPGRDGERWSAADDRLLVKLVDQEGVSHRSPPLPPPFHMQEAISPRLLTDQVRVLTEYFACSCMAGGTGLATGGRMGRESGCDGGRSHRCRRALAMESPPRQTGAALQASNPRSTHSADQRKCALAMQLRWGEVSCVVDVCVDMPICGSCTA